MEENVLIKNFEDCLSAGIVRIIVSNPRSKEGINVDDRNGIVKVKVRPVIIGQKLLYQITEYVGTQVFHTNKTEDELVGYVDKLFKNGFKQGEILTKEYTMNILVSKKGKTTISKKAINAKKIVPEVLSHNRTKNYILKEDVMVPFLVDLGVMSRDGKIITSKYDKFKQINRFLEFVRDILEDLPKNRQINIIDFGCGKSYLTFAIYYYLHEICGRDIKIVGLDLKKDVIKKCNELSVKYGYENLEFKLGNIADYEDQTEVDMVVTLHACDTATDLALYKAVKWGAKVILSVPCCQHEINGQIKNDLYAPVLKYGILKDRMSAIITDAIRAELLKCKGYSTEILEFIDMEHTPKNLLIRAVYKNGKNVGQDKEAVDKLINELKLTPTLKTLFDGMEEK